MLRYKLEARLRGLVAFSVLAVMGALVSGISAQEASPKITAVSCSVSPKVMVLSIEEPTEGAEQQITVVRMESDCPLPEPPPVPIPPQQVDKVL